MTHINLTSFFPRKHRSQGTYTSQYRLFGKNHSDKPDAFQLLNQQHLRTEGSQYTGKSEAH